MQLFQTDGIVLKSHNLAESDRIVVLYTKQSGFIRGVAHGARRLKSKFGGSLEPFTLIAIAYSEKEGRDLVTISSTDIKHSLFGQASRPELLSAFGYLANLMERFSPPHEPNERLFRLLTALTEALGRSECDIEGATRYFEIWLLKLSGFLPDLRKCFRCNSQLGVTAVFQDSELRLFCFNCSAGRGLRISSEAHSLACKALSVSPVQFAADFRVVDKNSRENLRGFSKKYIERVLETDPTKMLTAEYKTAS